MWNLRSNYTVTYTALKIIIIINNNNNNNKTTFAATSQENALLV